MDNRNVKSEIIEKIGVDEIIDEQMERRDPEAFCVLDEKDIARIKNKLRAEVEQELDERLDQEIEEQVERKIWEMELKAQLRKVIKRVGTIVAAVAAVYGVVLLATGIVKLFYYYKRNR